MLRVELGDWAALQRWAAPIRTTVFVDEQKVPAEMEIDDWDPQCLHAVAFDGEGNASGHRAAAAGRPHRSHGRAEVSARSRRRQCTAHGLDGCGARRVASAKPC